MRPAVTQGNMVYTFHTFLRYFKPQKVLGEVCEDNEDTTFQESSTKQDEALPVRQKVLQWNFLTGGVMYIRLLTDFLTKLGADDIVSACQKQPSFAGFWYKTKLLCITKVIH